MNFRLGLQARFLSLVAIALLLSAMAMAALLQRQWALRDEVLALSRQSIQELVIERLQEQAKAIGASSAEALVNPLYNFDLEIIGRIVGDILGQPDVQYVTVYDPSGAVIHDGTDAIASYGQAMTDPLARSIISASQLTVQRNGDLLDVSAPILLGDERLGGVRIGYSVASVKRYEENATRELGERLVEIGRRYLFGVVILFGVAIALGIGISFIMQRILIRPIRRLAQAAQQVEAGNLTLSLAGHDNGDEIGELILAFERMTEGIARRDRDIRRIANTDSLTGLANRRAFRERLDGYVAEGRDNEFALVLADIDDFKPVNDTLGHDMGDKLLMRFAERLRQVVNSHEEIEAKAARLGGDEFILLIRVSPGVSTPLRRLLERLSGALIDEFSRPAIIDEHECVFSASFGIALFPDDAVTPAQLMKAADTAMYTAKRAGKNRYHFFGQSTQSRD